MDTIGITQHIAVTASSLPLSTSKSQPAPTLPATLHQPQEKSVEFDTQSAERARAESVQRAAQQIANEFVLGDQTFSLFKDSTGQYITRFTNLRSGKVTYIPEPTLYKLGGGSAEATKLLKIQA